MNDLEQKLYNQSIGAHHTLSESREIGSHAIARIKELEATVAYWRRCYEQSLFDIEEVAEKAREIIWRMDDD